MVCKNCGADLKPGIKYCLNCGYYIDEEDLAELEGKNEEEKEEYDDVPSTDNNDFKMEAVESKKKRSRVNMSSKDIVIYAVLVLILVISILVLIFAPKGSKTNTIVTPSSTLVLEDNVVKVDNYEVTFDGNLRYTVEGKNLYITDHANFTFSYSVNKADFDKYSADLSILSSDLEKRGYKVLGSEKRTIDSNEIIIYNLKVSEETRYFYLIKVDETRLAMGTIENVENGNWSLALDEIVKLGKTIKFDNDSSTGEDLDSLLDEASSSISKGIKN